MDVHWIHTVNTMANSSGLRIRVDDELRSLFINACRQADTTAAQALRSYMRKYVEQSDVNRQSDFGFTGVPEPGAETESL